MKYRSGAPSSANRARSHSGQTDPQQRQRGKIGRIRQMALAGGALIGALFAPSLAESQSIEANNAKNVAHATAEAHVASSVKYARGQERNESVSNAVDDLSGRIIGDVSKHPERIRFVDSEAAGSMIDNTGMLVDTIHLGSNRVLQLSMRVKTDGANYIPDSNHRFVKAQLTRPAEEGRPDLLNIETATYEKESGPQDDASWSVSLGRGVISPFTGHGLGGQMTSDVHAAQQGSTRTELQAIERQAAAEIQTWMHQGGM